MLFKKLQLLIKIKHKAHTGRGGERERTRARGSCRAVEEGPAELKADKKKDQKERKKQTQLPDYAYALYDFAVQVVLLIAWV